MYMTSINCESATNRQSLTDQCLYLGMLFGIGLRTVPFSLRVWLMRGT